MRHQLLKSFPAAFIMAAALFSTGFGQQGSMLVKARTSSYGGKYSPKNCTVIWITDDQNAFIKTIGLWANKYRGHLNEWELQSRRTNGDPSDISGENWDGTTAASRIDQGTVTGYWDLTDNSGSPVGPGRYYYHVEMTEINGSGPYVYGEIDIAETSFQKEGITGENNIHPGSITNLQVIYESPGPDETAPSLVNVSALNQNQVRVRFSEPVDSISASNPQNYQISYYLDSIPQTVHNLPITSIALQPGGKTVLIGTEAHYSRETYTLTVSNIADRAAAGNVMVSEDIAYAYQVLVTKPITENVPFTIYKWDGLNPGSTLSTNFTVYDEPEEVRWAGFQLLWYDLDDTSEVYIYVNGNGPYQGDPDNTVDNGESDGSVDFAPSDLVRGINEVTFEFHSDVGGITNGFEVRELAVFYERWLLRPNTGVRVSNRSDVRQNHGDGLSMRLYPGGSVFIPNTSNADALAIYGLNGNVIANCGRDNCQRSKLGWNVLIPEPGMYIIRLSNPDLKQ